MTVKLEPTATIKGKVVNPGGAPVQAVQVTPMLAYDAQPRVLSR